MLQAEFDRLGIDPDKVTAKAPQKAENAVFDLAAELVDPDGEGGEDPTGITLTWTERLLGDYSQDGMVTANDISPIGQYWNSRIEYDAPELHSGIDCWPAGDPEDGGEGSMNWRLARVSGNDDVLIEAADFTPIAIHYEERLTGYRIWRKAPGGSFALIVNPTDAGSDVTIARPGTNSNSAPVRYSFSDNEATSTGLGEGSYAYYVQPWDGTSSTGGPVSAVVVIDNTGTVVPEQPVAQLTVTPDYGGAPVVVTLDASASTDSDGTVEVWHWDFDADGLTDWASDEMIVPEESSSGIVDTITPLRSSAVQVTFRQGSAQWFYPEVTVTDNDGLTSLPAYARLGISGWEHEMVGNDQGLAVIPFQISAVGRQPGTGIEYAAGHIRTLDSPYTPWTSGLERGTYFAWCDSPGNWTTELVADYDTPAWADYLEMRPNAEMVIEHLFWDENNQPGLLICMDAGMATDGHVYLAQRKTDGSWELVEVYEGQMPLNLSYRGVVAIEAEVIAPGKFIAIMREVVDGGVTGSTQHYYALWYDNGEYSIEDIGIGLHSQSASTGDRYIYDVAVDSEGTPFCLIRDWRKLHPNELVILRRESADNWVEERWDNGDMEPSGGLFMYGGCQFDAGDRLQVSVYVTDNSTEVPVNECRWYSCAPGSVILEQVIPVANPELDDSMALLGVTEGIGCFVHDIDGYFHCRLEPESAVKEEIWSLANNRSSSRQESYMSYPEGKAFSAMFVENYDSEVQPEYSQYFSRRLDPRY